MTESDLQSLAGSIPAIDPAILTAAQVRLDDLTKPPGSLGRLEGLGKRLCGIQGRVPPVVGRKRVYTLAADHGVTAEGVSAFPSEVTPQMVLNFLRGGAAINVLTRHVGAAVAVERLEPAHRPRQSLPPALTEVGLVALAFGLSQGTAIEKWGRLEPSG